MDNSHHARYLSRQQLARYAYDIACKRLEADRSIDAGKALAKYNRLTSAYRSRKETLNLGTFLRTRGYGFIVDRGIA